MLPCKAKTQLLDPEFKIRKKPMTTQLPKILPLLYEGPVHSYPWPLNLMSLIDPNRLRASLNASSFNTTSRHVIYIVDFYIVEQ